ncbi:MAG: FHA domain-containing protein, partial [Synechococcus sp.]
MSPSLRLHISGQPSREIQLLGQVYRLGRDPDAEIEIRHAAISKRHALLERRHGQWQLKDQGSTNGLSWKGRSVQLLALRDGDRIRLGPETDPSLPVLEFLDSSTGLQLGRWGKALSSG